MASLKLYMAVLVVLLNGSFFPLGWPSSQQSEKPVRLGISVVTLDVAVTDKRRGFVSGLDKKDFVVAEDGVEQSIDSFTTRGPKPSSTGPGARGAAVRGANTTKAGSEAPRFGGYRFISIVVDNTSLEPANRD